MATHFITSNLTSTGASAISDSGGALTVSNFDRVVIADGVLVGGATNGMRTNSLTNLSVTLLGDLYGSSDALGLALPSDAPSLNFDFRVQADPGATFAGGVFLGVLSGATALRDPDSEVWFNNAGTVLGDVTVQLAARAQISNDGLISHQNVTGSTVVTSNALRFSAVAEAVLVNTGEIITSDPVNSVAQTLVYAAGGIDSFYLTNAGLLSSPDRALYVRAQVTEEISNTGTIVGDLDLSDVGGTLINSGLIQGDIDTQDGDDTVENAGTIQGDLILGAGNDVLSLQGSGQVTGGILAGEDSDYIEGGIFGDYIDGGLAGDGLYGNGGEDTLFGREGNDYMSGGADDDRLFGGSENDTLIGGDGDDSLTGDSENDQLVGGNGDDTLAGGDDNDGLRGGAGFDSMDGGVGNDMLRGGHDDDTQLGDAGFDTLYGNGGHDLMDGGGRNDMLAGGKGDDTMTGGGGADLFIIRRVGNGDDEVTDFQNGSDRVDISALGVQNFNALNNQFNALSQTTDGVLVDLAAAGGSGSILLGGMTLADMDASDFIF